MNTLKINTLTNRIILGAFALIMLFSAEVSAKKVKFLTSSLVPAARGHVIINRDKNLNYNIRINISNLAEVERIETTKQTYVVWFVTEDDRTVNLGKISSTTGFLSKKLAATFETVTSFKPIKVFITAEEDPIRQYPENQIILSTGNF